MTQEFHLSITSLGSDRYLIRTEDTAMGVPIAETQVEWPVESWLQLAQPAMDDPLVELLKGQSNLDEETSNLHKLGGQLYKALFQEGAISESWLKAQGIAQNRHEMLRFRLGLKESRLQRLPWEVLHNNGRPLTTRSDLTFNRYVANLLVDQTFKVEDLPAENVPIQVLMVIASPHDQDHLKLLQESKHIKDLFNEADEAIFPIELHVLKQPDRSELARALEQGNYQILHYAGHSDFGESGGDLSLVNRHTGLTEKLSGEDLAGLLVNNHIALTVFNSCRSGHTTGDDAEMDWRQQNLVQALVNRGVPGVIAMAERIPDEVAIAFTQLFYRNLVKGYPIDLSLSRTRQGLVSAFGSNQHYWALPILYLQPEFDGYLTKGDRETEASTTEDLESPLKVSVSTPADLAEEAIAPLTPQEEDDKVARLVEELSKPSTVPEDPPMPAGQDEVLVNGASERSGMAIYNTLPEVPIPAAESPETTLPSHPRPLSSSNGAQNPPPSSDQPFTRSTQSREPEKLSLIWFTLGLIGVVGVIGLGALALNWARGLSDPPSIGSSQSSPLSPSGSVDVDTVLRQAEQAIQQQRYSDAREEFEFALTQELLGKTEPNAVSDAIWPLVSETSQPELLYIQGRIIWQQMALLGEDVVSYDRDFQERELAQQAREAWLQTSETFLKGRIAQGFADYATGDFDGAISNWEAALALHDEQRQRSADPDASTPADPVVLHAYAGLVMVRTNVAQLNLDGLAEDARLAEAPAEEQEILQDESNRELAIAQELFLRLQELDPDEQMSPSQLQGISQSQETWDNWFWTDSLLNDWRQVYREWETQLDDSAS
ncbi:MAG: CHAT domain-containing protein [Leptolyngbya sp. SIO1D8]|nr:CHAT domain-containing protein [Leptolyngbya sp. SIO1D8]